ncbi:protein lifeguard 2-like isoform X2 [Fopius arisanus]|uniref:Protein lifeguard 2-like isoform X2 n=1 Tax=Fopius arisanus TaxID=64838 RepID=A0A9R1TZQ8_9HYME|nr:PREDICTED: protein lifeguard 2-like isoform X2 [Fopius arisanus]
MGSAPGRDLNTRDEPPPYSSLAPQNYGGPEPLGMQSIPVAAGGPPYLPPLVKGQKIQSGPYEVIVDENMVRQREMQNQAIYRAWLEQQRRAAMPEDEYFAEFQVGKIRRLFIQKVFFILFLQFIFTALYIAFFMFYEPANIFIKMHWYLWVLAIISLTDCGRRQSGWGAICLLLLTLAESHLSAYVSVYFDVEVVLIAVSVTAAVSIFITIAAVCCRFDFTKYSGVLGILAFLGLMTLLLLMVTLMFTNIPAVITIFGCVGALIFSLYLYFDIQTIMGGRRIQISPDEVLFATTQLYVDIIGLYRYLLLVVGGSRS